MANTLPKWLPRRPDGWSKWVDTFAEFDDGNHWWETTTTTTPSIRQICIETAVGGEMYIYAKDASVVVFSFHTTVQHAELAVEILKMACSVINGFEDWG